jgi:tetratricopeptide (TPR) repeat protein
VIHVTDVAKRVVQRVLPDMGLRAPLVSDCFWLSLNAEGGEFSAKMARDGSPFAASAEAVRALELARLTKEDDDLLARGATEEARAHYLSALERAPRHPELARAIAEIDLASGGRAEAGLAVLTESLAATQAGVVGAELLSSCGDLRGAREAINLATVREAYAPLAGLSWARLAALEHGTQERLAALDHAVAHAPSLESVRRARFEGRLARGDKQGALADAQQLEVMAHGKDARHQSCLAVAKAFSEAGFVDESRVFYERALRYLPQDAAATAGLARAFVRIGERERGAFLLSRADKLTAVGGERDPELLLDLALVLAALDDLPQAISRLREVAAQTLHSFKARALEGEYLAKLGDLVGASQSYAQMREEAEYSGELPSDAPQRLGAAARFEQDVMKDVLAAERLLAVSLKLAPADPTLRTHYRELGEQIARERRRDG